MTVGLGPARFYRNFFVAASKIGANHLRVDIGSTREAPLTTAIFRFPYPFHAPLPRARLGRSISPTFHRPQIATNLSVGFVSKRILRRFTTPRAIVFISLSLRRKMAVCEKKKNERSHTQHKEATEPYLGTSISPADRPLDGACQ